MRETLTNQKFQAFIRKLLLLLILFYSGNQSIAQCWEKIEKRAWHAFAIQEDGKLLSWGLNQQGQLGIGTTIDRLEPIQINCALGEQKILK
ncbi:RCC1 domain-containing protein [Aequorivita antarctica]|uniref:Uncharacterized protein n=1 Tax=Aequorivita antarctica TaxID=153266 RepID=A0A5C6Z2H2_9FLAO|nr:RCC1 domain-containing protein [Aequorivita antarctica]TXD74321.1 hypothetical protein ESU54_03450 [Aequorivita antarctica]SRX73666.1 hypothetical protein AEQU3_01098 [Aequorivita antarctica]